MYVYTGAKTVVRTVCGNSKGFEVKVSMHQDSALSPLLFMIFLEALSREFWVTLPCELYVDDWVVIAESKDDIITRLTTKNISLIVRGRLYSSCVQSSMLHGSETWPVKKENEVALQQSKMRMVDGCVALSYKIRVPSKG